MTAFHGFPYVACVLRRTLVAVLLVALPLASACSGDDGDDGPSASVTTASSRPSTTSSSVALTPEQEVEAAYLRSWDVYAKAVRALDPAGLEESYTGEALETVRAEVERYADANTPVIVDVQHDITVGVLTATDAQVHDRYVSRTHRTGEDGTPIDDPTDESTYEEKYRLKRISGRWLITGFERLSAQP